MKTIFLLIAALAAPESSLAATIGPCDSPEARAFDFWIGDWSIQQKILNEDGTWLTLSAKTSVSPALDGCALIEHWEGQVQFFWEGMQSPELTKGLSVRAYDSESNRWYVHWMDSRTPRFGSPYVGSFREDRGEFFREWESPQGKRIGRITFSNVASDSVRWELAISDDDGTSWSRLWVMDMHRVKR